MTHVDAAAPSSPQLSSRAHRLATLGPRIVRRLRQGPYGHSIRYGLRRDLSLPFEAPSAKIPITVRPLRAIDDLPVLLALCEANAAEHQEISDRFRLAEKLPRHGFVAVDQRSDTPCYVQWLMGVEDNDAIRQLGGFPELNEDEALLEGAYTPSTHRGLGIMPAAMAQIAERAADIDARYVITFVSDTNIASLKGCQRAGFAPDLMHEYTQVGFETVRLNRFRKLDEDDPKRSLRF